MPIAKTLLPFLGLVTVVAGAQPKVATGTITGPAATTLPDPLFAGPFENVVESAHPPFTWPPTTPNPAPSCTKVQHKFPGGTNSNTSRADAVRDLYVASWNQYAKYCFGHDQINVLDNTCEDDIFGWGATIVDGIDTAIVMNLTSIVTRQLAFISTIDFTKANSLVDGFDAIIRYLGGLLSAYDLLKNGFDEGYDQNHVNALLSQAKTLGDKLKYQFETPSGLPAAELNFTTNMPVESTFTDPLNNKTYNATNLAVAGSLILEFYSLADLTGDQSFRTLANRCEGNLVFPNPQPVYPGLVGSELDVKTGNYLTYDFGWQAGIDSFREYLIKTYYYQPSSAATSYLKDFWVSGVDSSIKHIALHPYHHPELTYLSQADAAGNIEYAMDDYACFAGGNLLLGGVYLGRPDITALGLAVTDSCHAFYNTTTTGLGPLSWAWYNASNLAYDPSDDTNAAERAQASKYGYFITSPEWDSFPESIESIFYAYRITGDAKWQEYNWEIFQSVKRESTATVPAAPISDVEKPDSFINELPSYYFAEVLKYLYLSFTDPNVVNLDDYVFNTECHPLRRNAPQCGV